MDTTQLAQEIVDKTREQTGVLIGRNWPEIDRIIKKEGEIKLSFGVTVTDREPEPGNQAAKDNRLKTVISFSEKYSDSIEAPLDDPAQPSLPIQPNGAAAE